MVVAPHGAGLLNLIVSQPGIVLIEGLCPKEEDGKINLVFRSLVYVIGGHYFGYDKDCTTITAQDLLGPVNFYLNEKLSHRQQDF